MANIEEWSYKARRVRSVGQMLIAVRVAKERPSFEGKKYKGAAAKGIRYQRRVEKFLGAWRLSSGREKEIAQYNGLWLEFENENGKRICQPDIILVGVDRVVVVEVKLTQIETAEEQLSKLYMPLCGMLWGKPVIGVQVCKNMFSRPRSPVLKISTLFDVALIDLNLINTLHLTI